MLEHAGLAGWRVNRQRLAGSRLKFDLIVTVRLGAVDHDPIAAALGCHAHRASVWRCLSLIGHVRPLIVLIVLIESTASGLL
jgi:hypothetical protein